MCLAVHAHHHSQSTVHMTCIIHKYWCMYVDVCIFIWAEDLMVTDKGYVTS